MKSPENLPGVCRARDTDATYSWQERARCEVTSAKPWAVGYVPANYEVPYLSIRMLPCSVS